MTLSGIFSAASVNIKDAVLSFFTGIPFTESSVSDSFIEKLDEKDVVLNKYGSGIYKKLLLVFFDSDSGVADKYRVLKNYNLDLLGWACPCNLFVVSAPASGFDALSSLSKKMEDECEAVLMASPMVFTPSSPDTTPDDPFDGAEWDESRPEGGEWHLEAVQAREAWNYSRYFGDITVGIVDAGFNMDHEDLQGKISFPNNRLKKRNVPDSHGTYVAGTVCAEAGNGKGVSGINPRAVLKCVDWQTDEGQDWNQTLAIFFGIIRLIKSGAKIVNLSLGTSGNVEGDKESIESEMNLYAKVYSAMISILFGRGYDFVCGQSAGHGGTEGYPVDTFINGHFCTINKKNAISIVPWVKVDDILDRVIIAAASRYRASDDSYILTSFSNYGENVDIAAPGSRIYGLDVESDAYCYKSGTSVSAPIVTGIASLVWGINPSLKGSEVKKIIIDTADKTAAPCVVGTQAYKQVNAKLAVEAALRTKYKMFTLTGNVNTGDYDTPDDLVVMTVNGKAENITAPGGKINLICESCNGKIEISGDYGENEFTPVDFSVDNADVDLGEISFVPVPEDPGEPSTEEPVTGNENGG
ncbi:MAG: S8 family serine peptidase, partial [Clostridia bacterium]|nr:S8 family serine peptidase [Clostridia bacterium]